MWNIVEKRFHSESLAQLLVAGDASDPAKRSGTPQPCDAEVPKRRAVAAKVARAG
jgi:hypothetical protein